MINTLIASGQLDALREAVAAMRLLYTGQL